MSIQTLRLSGLLSFAPDSTPLDLRDLNVLIGPNGSGKSNLIEALELLAAMPRDLSATIRDGGGASEWLWKGDGGGPAEIDAVLRGAPTGRPLRYRLQFDAVQSRVEVTDEAIEELEPSPGRPPGSDVFFYYRFQRGNPVINVADGRPRHLQRENLRPDQSVLAQRKDPDLYPEVTWVGERLGAFHTFREWSFGRYVALRQPQPADLPGRQASARQPQSCAGAQSSRARPGWREIERPDAAVLPTVRASIDPYFRGDGTVLSSRAGLRGTNSGNPPVRWHDSLCRLGGGVARPRSTTTAVCRGTRVGPPPRCPATAWRTAGGSVREDPARRDHALRCARFGSDRSCRCCRDVRELGRRHSAAAPRRQRPRCLAGRVPARRPLAHGRTRRQPMKGIAIYMEGGGTNREAALSIL